MNNTNLRFDDNSIYFNKKLVYKNDSDKILDVRLFKNNVIIVQLDRKHHNIISINKSGQLLWEAEDAFEGYEDPYLAFDMEDGFIHGRVCLANVKIDPNTGKVIDKKYAK